MPVDLNSAENIACDECGSEHFSPAFVIKQVPALLSPTGKQTLIPIQIFKCNNCSHVNDEISDNARNINCLARECFELINKNDN